jgi:hypothetical protein
MKRALYYAIRVNTLYPHVVAVTSEKQNGIRWFGRKCRDDTATHGRASDIRGRFATQEEAIAMKQKVGDLSAAYNQLRCQVSDYSFGLRKLENDGMDALFRGEEPAALPHVARVEKRWIAGFNAEWHGDGVRGGDLRGALGASSRHIDESVGGVVFVLPDRTRVTEF